MVLDSENSHEFIFSQRSIKQLDLETPSKETRVDLWIKKS